MAKLKSKLPGMQEIIPVFSLATFMVFSWAFYRAFFNAPSWLKYMDVWDILVLMAYVLSFALFESVVVLGLALLLSLIFPARHFKDKFVAQGSMFVLVISVGAFALQQEISKFYKLPGKELIIYPIVTLAALIALIFIFSYIFERFEFTRRFIKSIADRMTVFPILYVPLGIIGLVVVVLRNLF